MPVMSAMTYSVIYIVIVLFADNSLA